MSNATQAQAAGKQKFLGRSGLIAFIVIMNMFVPLSIDFIFRLFPD